MPGVPGAGGTIPKRSDQRRRRNQDVPVDRARGAAEVDVPDPDPEWHEIARMWFVSLAASGQSTFYEPSDWAVAYLLAESLSRDLSAQVVGVSAKGEAVWATIPLKGASLAAYLKAMTALLVTEGDRRRLRLELSRGGEAGDDGEAAKVAALSEYRNRASAG